MFYGFDVFLFHKINCQSWWRGITMEKHRLLHTLLEEFSINHFVINQFAVTISLQLGDFDQEDYGKHFYFIYHYFFTIVVLESSSHSLFFWHAETSKNDMYFSSSVMILEIKRCPPSLSNSRDPSQILTLSTFWCSEKS